MNKKSNLYLTILTSLILVITAVFFKTNYVCADNVTKEIVIGQSCDLSGPLKKLGIGVRDGALAYFKYVNETGGIRGQKIRFITYDDNNDVKKCFENTKQYLF